MLRVVIDTNIFVSGLLNRHGAPAQILDSWRQRRFLLVVSPKIIAEVKAVLSYPRIRDRYALNEESIVEVVQLLENYALCVPGRADVTGSVPLDPKDEVFLSCAFDGQADLVVSGDHHLLDLGKFRDIPILTVPQFLDRLAHEEK